jgi:hypothetical protein
MKLVDPGEQADDRRGGGIGVHLGEYPQEPRRYEGHQLRTVAQSSRALETV